MQIKTQAPELDYVWYQDPGDLAEYKGAISDAFGEPPKAARQRRAVPKADALTICPWTNLVVEIEFARRWYVGDKWLPAALQRD